MRACNQSSTSGSRRCWKLSVCRDGVPPSLINGLRSNDKQHTLGFPTISPQTREYKCNRTIPIVATNDAPPTISKVTISLLTPPWMYRYEAHSRIAFE